MWISPKLFLDQFNAWINRKLVSREVRCSALSRNNGVPGGGAFHRRKWFCKQRKWFHLERLFRLEARFHDFVAVDWFARWYINFLGGIEVRGQRSWSWNINFGTETSAGRNKQQLKANRGVGIIVAQNNQSSQMSISVKHRRAVRTKTLKCKQITPEIKAGKQQRCY